VYIYVYMYTCVYAVHMCAWEHVRIRHGARRTD